MDSVHDRLCSHSLDFSIRKSPDHRLLASPRGLSQLATSFIAFLRQGIHTHALSSLTIKFTLHTSRYSGRPTRFPVPVSRNPVLLGSRTEFVLVCPSVFSFQRSALLALYEPGSQFRRLALRQTPVLASSLSREDFDKSGIDMVGLDRLELSTSPLSGVRSSHLSYRPMPLVCWWS
jgi:hypothetical protein